MALLESLAESRGCESLRELNIAFAVSNKHLAKVMWLHTIAQEEFDDALRCCRRFGWLAKLPFPA